MSIERKTEHNCEALARRFKLSSMRLYNSVSCTPIGTTQRGGASKWTPPSFLPHPSTKTTSHSSRLPRTWHPQSPIRLTQRKTSFGKASSATQPSPMSNNSDVTETTKVTAPVGGSFDSFHFDLNMAKTQSSPSTSRSDPSLYAISSSSTWTTSASLFRGPYEPFEEGSERNEDYIELHKLALLDPANCGPPVVVETPVQASSQFFESSDIRNLVASGFHKALDGRNSTPRSRKTRKARATPTRKMFSVSDTAASPSESLKRFRDKAWQPMSSFSSYRDLSCKEQACSHVERKIGVNKLKERSLPIPACQEGNFPSCENDWNGFQYVETDDASDFHNEFGNLGEVVRCSPFTPIERPPPAPPAQLIAPLPYTPVGWPCGTNGSVDSEVSKTPSSLTLLMRRSGSKRQDRLNVPRIEGVPVFRSFPDSRVIQKPVQSQTRPQESTTPASRKTVHSSLIHGMPNTEEMISRVQKYSKNLRLSTVERGVTHADGSIKRDALDITVIHPIELSEKSLNTSCSESSFHRYRSNHGADWNMNPDTVWGMLEKDLDLDFQNGNVTEDHFHSLFRADELLQRQGSLLTLNDGECTFVINPQRASDGSIILAGIDMSYEDIAAAIEKLDMNAMNADQLTRILPFLPTRDEKKDLLAFLAKNSKPFKTECEKFMVAMLVVLEAKRKVKAMILMKIFADCMESIRNDAIAVLTACAELISNSRFRKILGIILALGNRLNANGTNRNLPVKAIKVESLLDLADKKMPCGETTMMKWIARVVIKHYPNLVGFIDTLPGLLNVDHVNWESSLTEFEEFEEQLYDLRWLALGQGGETEENEEPRLSIPEEIERLRSSDVGIFTLGACVRMATVADEIEQAQNALSALVQYFGEDEWYTHPHKLLSVVATFCVRFDAALREEIGADSVICQEPNVTGVDQSQVLPKAKDPSPSLAEKVDEIYQSLADTVT